MALLKTAEEITCLLKSHIEPSFYLSILKGLSGGFLLLPDYG
jgi:hypothetical protein